MRSSPPFAWFFVAALLLAAVIALFVFIAGRTETEVLRMGRAYEAPVSFCVRGVW